MHGLTREQMNELINDYHAKASDKETRAVLKVKRSPKGNTYGVWTKHADHLIEPPIGTFSSYESAWLYACQYVAHHKDLCEQMDEAYYKENY